MNPPTGPEYDVPISGAVRDLLVRLHDEAAADGRRTEFLTALKSISRRLRTDPAGFGEELFDLRALHLTINVAVVYPLVVEFGIYEDRRLVFIRTFRYVTPA